MLVDLGLGDGFVKVLLVESGSSVAVRSLIGYRSGHGSCLVNAWFMFLR